MKNIFVKLLSVLLTLVMLGGVLVSCQVPDVGGGESSSSETETEPEGIPTPLFDAELVVNGATSYKIVRSETATEYEKTAASGLIKTFAEKTGVSISASDDFINEALGYTVTEFEILIGQTNREESELVYSNLRADDYAVTIVNKKVVIAAHNEEKMTEAVNYFIEKLQVADGGAKLLAADAKVFEADYEVEKVTIAGTDISKFKIIYKSGAPESIKNAAKHLEEKINEYGFAFSAKTDVVEETEYEILVGGSSRGDSIAKGQDLLVFDYKVFIEGTKVYILAGNSEKAINDAVDAFLSKLAGLLEDGKIAVTAENIKTEFASDSYKTKAITLNGIDIKNYTVVYPQGNSMALKMADSLCDAIEVACGRRLGLVSDSSVYTKGPEILVGYGKRITKEASALAATLGNVKEGQYVLFGQGDFFFAGGKQDDNMAMVAALNKLIKAINGVTDPLKNDITFSETKGTAVSGTKYSIVTYNDGDNGYQNVKERMVLIGDYLPDIVGFQETQTPHAEAYKQSLKIYDYVLYDNDGTTFNSQPIFWKRDMFDCLDSGIKWLSDTPDVMSKYPDSEYTRSFTYAVLKDKKTGEEFVVVNTHMDFAKVNAKQTARLMELTQEFRDKPMVFLGDFNMHISSAGYNNMYNEGFVDAGAYLNKNEDVIDFIMIDITQVVATDYKIIRDHQFSKTGSDHLPIMAEIMIIGSIQ